MHVGATWRIRPNYAAETDRRQSGEAEIGTGQVVQVLPPRDKTIVSFYVLRCGGLIATYVARSVACMSVHLSAR